MKIEFEEGNVEDDEIKKALGELLDEQELPEGDYEAAVRYALEETGYLESEEDDEDDEDSDDESGDIPDTGEDQLDELKAATLANLPGVSSITFVDEDPTPDLDNEDPGTLPASFGGDHPVM